MLLWDSIPLPPGTSSALTNCATLTSVLKEWSKVAIKSTLTISGIFWELFVSFHPSFFPPPNLIGIQWDGTTLSFMLRFQDAASSR